MKFREELLTIVDPATFDGFEEVRPDYPVSPGAHIMTVLPEVAKSLAQATSWEDAEALLSELPDETLLRQAEAITNSSDGWFGWPWQCVYAIGHAIHQRMRTAN